MQIFRKQDLELFHEMGFCLGTSTKKILAKKGAKFVHDTAGGSDRSSLLCITTYCSPTLCTLIYLYIGTRYRRTVNKQVIDFKLIPAAPLASLGSMVMHTFAACCLIFTTTRMAHDDRITSIVRNRNFKWRSLSSLALQSACSYNLEMLVVASIGT